MSDENGQEIRGNVYDELIEDEWAAAPQPVEVVREQMVTITKNSDTVDNDNEDELHELVKAHSYQISRLTDIVDSLQSQIKQLKDTRSNGRKTGSARRSNIKTKKNKVTSKKPKGKSSKRK